MREARVALVIGLTLIAIALAALLSAAPEVVARTNGIQAAAPLAHDDAGATICQAGETLPGETSAIVIALSAFHGPRVTADVLAGTRVLTSGRQGSNWSGRTVTIPVRPLDRTFSDVTICFAFAVAHELVSPYGVPTPPALAASDNGAKLPGRLMVEDLKPGSRSWWSLASSIAHHMGFGRATGGLWAAVLAIALAVMVVASASAALLRELR
jgi:hypothetical protein